MNIINHCKFINNKQIENIINSLSEEYKDVNVNIIFLSNKYQILRYFYLKGIWKIISILILGIPYDVTCIRKDNYIFICVYKLHMKCNNEDRDFLISKCIQSFNINIRKSDN